METSGLYLVHKPVGVTSFSLVLPELGGVPLCHGGTLDPFAHGLLLLLAGPLTRTMDLLHALPKTYVAEVAWGRETDTGDAGGAVTLEGAPGELTPAALDEALRPFLGWTEQVPPPTSAKKVGGEPAYRKVHRGESVTLPPSRVYLHAARWRSHDLPLRSVLELESRGGYYVRALARDLGRALGCGAHLVGLHRSRVGPWEDPGPQRRVRLAGRDLFPWWPSRALEREELRALKRGEPVSKGRVEPAPWSLPRGFPAPPPLVRGFREDALFMLLRPEGDWLLPGTYLRGGV